MSGTDRAFWVIERFENGRSFGYWDGGSSRSFVSNIQEAVQFSRHKDAFWATRGWHWSDTQIIEHMEVALRATAACPCREALGAALVAMKVASALPAVAREYDFSEAIQSVDRAYVYIGSGHGKATEASTDETKRLCAGFVHEVPKEQP